MSGGAAIVAGLDPGPRLKEEAGGSGRTWLAVLLALAAGWGAFLAYGAAFLTEDEPLRPAAVVEQESGLDFPGPGAAPLQTARRVAYGLDETRRERSGTEGPPPSIPPLGETRALPAEPAQPVRTGTTAESAAHERPGPERPAAERLDHVGVWGPNAAACGAPHRRRGYYQATISNDRARAGRTICTFHDGRRIGNAWVTAADCSDRGRHWSSQVRLVVEGDRLTWTSARGTSSYVRCNRRPG